jgi:hypothetical protein
LLLGEMLLLALLLLLLPLKNLAKGNTEPLPPADCPATAKDGVSQSTSPLLLLLVLVLKLPLPLLLMLMLFPLCKL